MRRTLTMLPVLLATLAGAAPASAWTWPADGPVLQPFTFGGDPYAAGLHRGIDIQSGTGAAVRAPASGTVTFAGTVPGGGRSVTITTPGGYAVTLVHLGTIGVSASASVTEGASVGTIGPSGEAEHAEPYVHLGLRIAADPQGYVDPTLVLPARPLAEPAADGPPTPGAIETAEPAPVSSSAAPAVDGGEPAPAATAPPSAVPPVGHEAGVRPSSAPAAPPTAPVPAAASAPEPAMESPPADSSATEASPPAPASDAVETAGESSAAQASTPAAEPASHTRTAEPAAAAAGELEPSVPARPSVHLSAGDDHRLATTPPKRTAVEIAATGSGFSALPRLGLLAVLALAAAAAWFRQRRRAVRPATPTPAPDTEQTADDPEQALPSELPALVAGTHVGPAPPRGMRDRRGRGGPHRPVRLRAGQPVSESTPVRTSR